MTELQVIISIIILLLTAISTYFLVKKFKLDKKRLELDDESNRESIKPRFETASYGTGFHYTLINEGKAASNVNRELKESTIDVILSTFYDPHTVKNGERIEIKFTLRDKENNFISLKGEVIKIQITFTDEANHPYEQILEITGDKRKISYPKPL